MKSRKTKSIVMLAVLLAVLAIAGLPQAQSASVNLKQLAALNTKTSIQESGDALTVGLCILNAANQNLGKLDACGEDIVCRSAILLDALLDTLVCTNPDDANLALYACISDTIVAVAEIRATCGEDRACSLPKFIPVILNLSNCFGDENTASGR
jgi:hypothetical protein